MKNFKKIGLATMLFVPALLLVGCNDPKTFSLSTFSSNGNLGSVSSLNLKPYAEGSHVTISATARPNTNSKFLCWLHQQSTIVSTQSTTQITVSEASQGRYTAVFSEPSFSSMDYATASSLYIDNSTVENITYQIQYSSSNNSAVFITLASGTIKNGGFIETNSVLYMENAYSYNFRLNATVSYVGSNDTTTLGTINLSEKASNSAFGSDKDLVLSSQTGRGQISLTLSKLNEQMFVK